MGTASGIGVIGDITKTYDHNGLELFLRVVVAFESVLFLVGGLVKQSMSTDFKHIAIALGLIVSEERKERK